MSVHKDKSNKTWYVKYKNKTKRGFKSKAEANFYEAKLKIEETEIVEFIKFHDLAYDYLNDLKTKVTFGTYQKSKAIIEKYIIPNSKNKPISKYTELDCRNFYLFINELNYSTDHKNYILRKYRALFKHAIKFFNLRKDVSCVIEPLKKNSIEKIQAKEKEMNVWSIDEFNRFISFVDKEPYKHLFVILYYTGLRLGEALALQWKDFYNNELHIYKSLTRKTNKGTYEIKDTKNMSSIRNVNLGINITSYLLQYKASQEQISGFCDEWFIFGNIIPLHQTNIDRVKSNAIKQSNVRRIRIHDFRHSHASNLIANGVNIVAVSKRLGHSDINTTLKIYTHLLNKTEKEMIDYIEKSSQNLLKTKEKPIK